MNVKKIVLGTMLTAALVATSPSWTARAAAADGTAEQLATVTSAMNSIPDVVFYKDLSGVYRGGNTAWGALVGKPVAEIVGKTDADLFPAAVAKSVRENDQAMLASGKSRSNEETLVYPDGRKVLVDTTKTPWVGADGKVIGVLGICHAIRVGGAAGKGEGKN